MKTYTIHFISESPKSGRDETLGSYEEVNRADIVVSSAGTILKDRYGNATDVLADMHRRLTA